MGKTVKTNAAGMLLMIVLLFACLGNIVLADGPVLIWSFNEGSGTTAEDSSGNGNDGSLTNMGAYSWVDGISCNALEFDGSDDYVIATNPSGMSSSVGSVSFWMKADVDSQAGTLFYFLETDCTDYIRCHLNSYNKLDLVIEDGNDTKVLVNYDLDNLSYDFAGKWIHVAWVQDGTGIKLYIDGDEKSLNVVYDGSWWTDHLSISEAIVGLGWGTFDGSIENFKVYDKTLSLEEIRRDYELNVSVWHFDETQGTTANDECDLNDGTIYGATINQTGALNTSYSFDGTGDYVAVSSNPEGLSSDVGTIEFCMKADVLQNACIFYFYETAYTDYIRCYLNNYGKLDLVIEDGNYAEVNIRYDLDKLSYSYLGEWVHIVWVQDGTGVKLYVDGEEKTLSVTTNGSYWTDHLSFSEARFGLGWGAFEGGIDEFMVYNRPLGETEIYQKYIDHKDYKSYGCEYQNTGDPIGGGSGYSDILFANDADYEVDTKAELLVALSNATSGEIIFVDGSCTIDLTGENDIEIPDGVTLASDRGYNGSSGALLKDDSSTSTNEHLFVAGENVRITGLRIQGPDANTTSTDNSDGIASSDTGLEVDNCEISAWGHAGIFLLPGATGADIHHNYIHHCQRNGLGYGVSHGYGNASSLIEANKFDYNRHCVAGTGVTGNSYEARYNLVLEHSTSHVFDMHGADEGGDDHVAGDNIYIHHNTVQVQDQYAVNIRGIPNNEALIYNNRFERNSVITSIVTQSVSYGNYSVYDNLVTPQGTYAP